MGLAQKIEVSREKMPPSRTLMLGMAEVDSLNFSNPPPHNYSNADLLNLRWH